MAKRLLLIARSDERTASLEFIAATGDGNIEDRMTLLTEQTTDAPLEHEISLRLLRHFASSVRHQQYHDADIVALQIEAPMRERKAKA